MSTPHPDPLDKARRISVEQHFHYPRPQMASEYFRTVVGDRSVRPARMADRHPRIAALVHFAFDIMIMLVCYLICLALLVGVERLWDVTF